MTERKKRPAQCAYSVDGLQCPAPAVVARYPRGGVWFCGLHARCTSPKEGRAIIDYYETKGVPVPRRDWRDELMEKTMSDLAERKRKFKRGEL